MNSLTGADESTPKPETGTSFYLQTIALNSKFNAGFKSALSLCLSFTFTSPPGLRIHLPSNRIRIPNFESNSKFGSFANFAAFAARRRSLPHYSGLNSILPGLQTSPFVCLCLILWPPSSHSLLSNIASSGGKTGRLPEQCVCVQRVKGDGSRRIAPDALVEERLGWQPRWLLVFCVRI